MKKLLIATSAVVGLGLVSANHAAAQVETSLSGFVRVDLSRTGLDNGNAQFDTSRTQIQWSASGTSDSGLTYGAQLRIRNGNTVDNDNSVYFGGGFGTVTLGRHNGAASIGNGVEKTTVGTFGIDGSVSQASGIATVGHDIDAHLTGGSKITYKSPNFGGFTAAVSADFDSDGTGEKDSGYDIGLAYDGNFGDSSVGGHISLGRAKAVTAGTAAVAAVTTPVLDANDAQIGTVVTTPAVAAIPATSLSLRESQIGAYGSFGPVTVGATYHKTRNERAPVAGVAQSQTKQNTVAVGVAYNFGAGNMALNYAASKDSTTSAVNKKRSIIVSADYTVAPGWVVAGDIARNKGTLGTVSSSATSWILRNQVSF